MLYLLYNAHANYLIFLFPFPVVYKMFHTLHGSSINTLTPHFFAVHPIAKHSISHAFYVSFLRMQNRPAVLIRPRSSLFSAAYNLHAAVGRVRTPSRPAVFIRPPPRPSLFLPRTIPPPPPAAYNPVSLIRPPLPRGWPSSFAPRHSRPCSEASRPLTNPSRPAVLI